MNPTRRISKVLLAKKLGIHRNTLRAKLKENSINSSFTEMPDKNLDQIVKGYLESHPNSGFRYLTGRLRTHGLRIQRRRLQQSMKRVDQLGQTLRHHMTAKNRRREYHVSRGDALWHIDGHHRLIHRGIVTHRVVDGSAVKVDS